MSAAALAAMDVLEEDRLVENARERGAQLVAGARTIAAEFPEVIREVRGLGLLVGVELTSEGYGGWIIPEMLKAGVTAAWTLNLQRVIRLEPPPGRPPRKQRSRPPSLADPARTRGRNGLREARPLISDALR